MDIHQAIAKGESHKTTKDHAYADYVKRVFEIKGLNPSSAEEYFYYCSDIFDFHEAGFSVEEAAAGLTII